MKFPIATGQGEVTLEITDPTPSLTPTQQSHLPIAYSHSAVSVIRTKVPFIQSKYKYRQSSPLMRTSKINDLTYSKNGKAKESPDAPYQLLQQVFLIGFGMILCGIPLAVISTLYAQQKESWTTTTTTTNTTGNASWLLPSQCSSATVINDSTRSINAGAGALCDNTLVSGWFRFTGAGTIMATSAVSRDTCTTYYGGSYSGKMPSIPGATEVGTLCVMNNGYVCYTPYSGALISVTNCNNFYVYYLSRIMNCNSRYCITNP